MADDFSGILIKIDIANSQKIINTQMTEIQNWFKNNHNLKIDLNISDSALKGLEKLGKEFGNTTNGIRSGWKDITRDIEKLNNIKNIKIDMVEKDGISRAVQKVGELKTATGQTVQITQKLIQVHDDAGKVIGEKWVESTRKIKRLNQDTINKMGQDLAKFKAEFQNNILKLDGSKSNSFISPNDAKALRELKAELGGIDIRGFNVPQDLTAKLNEIKSSFDKIKISADNAMKATKSLGTGNTGTSTETINKISIEIENLIKQYKAANISAKEFMDKGIKLAGNTDIDQRIKLLNVLKTAQKEYDSVINQESKTNSSISNNVYAQQKQALEGVYSLIIKKMDAEKKGQIELSAELQKQLQLEGQKYALATKNIKSGGLTDSAREIELLNTKLSLQTELNNRKTKEIDITRQNNQNNAYAQLEQSLKNILDLSSKRIDAEKRGHVELTAQLQEQIRLEGQKYATARQDIRSNGLSDSSREVEFLNLKNTLQTEYNNKKIREGDISRQNALDNQHWLSIQQQDFASQTTKFAQQKSGLYNTSEFERLQREMAALTPTTENVRQRVENLRASFRSLDAEAVSNGLNNANKSAMSFGESIQVAAYKMGIWLGVGNLIFGVISQLKQSLVFLSDMNQGFTNMSLEMTDVNLNFNEITQSANNYAIAMGTTTTAVMRGLEVFSTYNSTLEESIKKTQAAAIMSNITGQSMTDSADQLMGTLAQYRLGAEDALGIVDTIASVARNLQVDFPKAVSEISNGMRTVGAVSAEAGVSVQELSGMLGTLVETTRRSGSQVANGLKMIFSRLGNVGEDTNPEEFVRIEKSLYNIGITMKDSATSIKPASVLLQEIASRWSTLNDIERQATATAVSSIHQRNIFVSLMQNYDKVLQNTTSATDANGVALQKQDIYMKSLKAHTSEFVASLQGLYLSMANQDTLKGLVDTGTGIVNVFSNLSSVLGTIPVLLGTAVVGIGLFSSKFREGVMGSVGHLKVLQMEMVKTNSTSVIGFKGFATAGLLDNMKNFSDRLRAIRTQLSIDAVFAGTSSNVSRLGTAFQALTGRTIGYTTAMIGARIATIAWQATLTVGLSFAISFIISKIINFTQKTEKAKEAFETLTKSISQLKKETSEIPSLISQYEELFPKLNKTTEEKEKLSTATARLSSLFGDSVIQLDSEGKAIEVDIEYVKQLTQAKKDLLIAQQQELASKFNSMGKDQYDEILEKQTRIKEINAEIAKNDNKVASLKNFDDPITGYINEKRIKGIQEATAELAEERKTLTGESSEIQKTLSQEAHAFDQSSDSANKLSQSLINNLAKATFDSGKGFDELKDTMEVFKNPEISEIFKRISEDMTKGASAEKATKDIHDMSYALVKNNVDLDIASALLKIFKDAMKLDNAPETIANLKDMTVSSKELADSLKDVTSVATDVSKAMEEYNETGKLSASTIVDLVTKYPELIDQLKVENGQLTLNKEAVQGLLDVRINGMITALEAEKTFTSNQAEQTKVRISNLIAEAEAIRQRNNALNALPTFLSKPTLNPSTGTIWLNEEDKMRAEANALQSQLNADNGVDDKISAMKALLGNIKSAANSGSYNPYKKEKEEKELSIQSLTESLLAQIKVESDLQKAKSDSIQKELEQAKSAKDYQLTLIKTNELVASQAEELRLLNSARDKVNQLKDSSISSSKFGDTSRWFTGESNEESTTFVKEKNAETNEKVRASMDEEFKSMQLLRNGWVSYTKSIEENTEKQKENQSLLNKINQEFINSEIELSKARMSLLNEGSIEYNSELSKQISLYNELIETQDKLSAEYLNTQSTIKSLLTSDLTSNYDKSIETINESLESYSTKLDETLTASEERIEKYNLNLSNLDFDMSLLQSSDYSEKINLLNDAIDESSDKANRLATEFNRLSKTTVYSEEDAEKLRTRLQSLKNEMQSTNKQTIEYVKTLEEAQFSQITSEAKLAQDEIDRLTYRINSNRTLLEDGMLSGTSLSFDFTLPNGNTLDLSSITNNSLDNIEEIEVKVDDSLQNQLDSTEEHYEDMMKLINNFFEVILNSNSDYNSDIENKSELSLNNQFSEYKSFYSNLSSLITSSMKNASVIQKGYLQDMLNNVSNFNSDLDVDIPSSNSGSNSNTTIKHNADGSYYIFDKNGNKIGWGAKGTEGYAKGTPKYGTPNDELSQVSEKGRELIINPDGKVELSGDNGPELRYLPKGTHVIPNKETEELLKNRSFASGTEGYDKLIEILSNAEALNAEKVIRNYSGSDYSGYEQYLPGHMDELQSSSWIPMAKYENGKIVDFIQSISVNQVDEILALVEKGYQFVDKDMVTLFTAGLTKAQTEATAVITRQSNEISGILVSSNQGYKDVMDTVNGEISAFQTEYATMNNNIEAMQTNGSSDAEILTATQTRDKNVNEKTFNWNNELFTAKETSARGTIAELTEYMNNNTLTEEAQTQVREAIQTQNEIINQALEQRKQNVSEYFTYQQSLRDKDLQNFTDSQDDIQFSIDMTDENDYSTQINLSEQMIGKEKDKLNLLESQKEELVKQRDEYKVGSYEWNNLNNQVENYGELIEDATLNVKENGEALSNLKLDSIIKPNEGNQSLSDTAISYYQKVLEYQELIGASSEDQIETQNTILGIQKYKLSSLTSEKTQLQELLAKQEVGSELWKETRTKIDIVTLGIQDATIAVEQTNQEISKIDFGSIVKPFDDAQANLDTQISKNEKLINLYELQGKSQEEISALVKENVENLQEKLVSEEAELVALEAKLATQKEGTEEWKETKSAIDNANDSILDTKTSITQAYSDIADEIIEAYKEAYKKQEEIALASIDKQKEAYDELIDDKIKALSDISSDTDYEEELTEAQNEAIETQSKIDALSLDDSIEGKAKKLELAKTLAEQEHAIAKMQRHRDVSEQTKSLEEKKTKNAKAVETQKQITTAYYDGLINDDKKYANIRQQIYAGNFTAIQTDFAIFNANFKSQNQATVDALGLSWQGLQSIIDKLTTSQNLLRSLPPIPVPVPVPTPEPKPIPVPIQTPSSITQENTGIKGTPKVAEAISEVITVKAEDFKNKVKIGTKIYDILDMSAINLALDSGLVPKTFTNGKWVDMFDTGGITGNWGDSSGKLALVHSKERILSQNQTLSFENLVKNLPSITGVLDKLMVNNPLSNIMNNFKIPDYSSIMKQIPQQNMEFKFDNLINVEGNVDRDALPDLKSIASYTINEMNKTFNRKGILRRK